jgi:hypothetical protein
MDGVRSTLDVAAIAAVHRMRHIRAIPMGDDPEIFAGMPVPLTFTYSLLYDHCSPDGRRRLAELMNHVLAADALSLIGATVADLKAKRAHRKAMRERTL